MDDSSTQGQQAALGVYDAPNRERDSHIVKRFKVDDTWPLWMQESHLELS